VLFKIKFQNKVCILEVQLFYVIILGVALLRCFGFHTYYCF